MWTANILRIDLSTQRNTTDTVDENVLQDVIGGKGLGAYLLHRELHNPKTDPLAPENPIIIATGPAQGFLPIAGRYTIVTKAPHTGIFIDSHVGGYVGPELRFAGYAAVVIVGRATTPVYISIHNEQIEILSAEFLRGKTTYSTEETLQKIHPNSRVISIGPAGENMVQIACTNSDKYRNAGRGGIGMLFGSKNLKAVVIRGTHKLEIPESAKEVIREINKRAKDSREGGHLLPKYGTAWLVRIANSKDQIPTFNYQRGEWEHVNKIDGKAIEDTYKEQLKKNPCYKCPLSCAYLIKNTFDWAEEEWIQHPEYESIGLLGSNLGIADLEMLLRINHMCNLYGLDTISTGSTISWFMECYQRGKIPEQYKNEAISFGDAKGVLDMLEKITYKKGVGAVLATGVRDAAAQFGDDTADWAVHIRGLELPAWDPRGKLGMAMSYVTSNVGASHLRGWPITSDIPNKSMLPIIDSLIEQQDLKVLKDSLIMCHFTHSISPALNIEDTARIFEALTGIPTTSADMRAKAQKIWILSRQFNVLALDDSLRATDILPKRLLRDPLPSGSAKGATAFVSDEDFEKSLDVFYKKRMCTKEGIPSEYMLQQIQHLLP